MAKEQWIFLFASVLPLSVSWPICFGSTSRFSKYLNASYSSTESAQEGKGKEKKYKKDKGCYSPQLTYLTLFLLQWHLESKVAPDHIWQRTTAALMPMGLNLVVCLATPCDGTACLLNHLPKGKTDWDVTRVSPTLNIVENIVFFFCPLSFSMDLHFKVYTDSIFTSFFLLLMSICVACVSPCFCMLLILYLSFLCVCLLRKYVFVGGGTVLQVWFMIRE